MINQKGQSLLELLTVIGMITFIVFFCLNLSLLGFTKSYIQHIGYQSLICKNTDGFKGSFCREKSLLLLKLLPFGKLNKFRLTKNKVHIVWKFEFTKKVIQLSTKQKFSLQEWI